MIICIAVIRTELRGERASTTGIEIFSAEHPTAAIRSEGQSFFDSKQPQRRCAEYIKKLLAKVSAKYGKAFSDDASDLFDRVGLAGFKLKKIKYAGLSDFNGNRRVVYINPGSLSGGEDDRHLEHYKNGYAIIRVATDLESKQLCCG